MSDIDLVRVLDPKKDKIIVAGFIEGKTFVKEITKPSHFLRLAQGYVIQESAIEICRARQIENINFRIFGKDNIITLEYFLKNSPIPKDRGHGYQHEISLERIKRGIIKEEV